MVRTNSAANYMIPPVDWIDLEWCPNSCFTVLPATHSTVLREWSWDSRTRSCNPSDILRGPLKKSSMHIFWTVPETVHEMRKLVLSNSRRLYVIIQNTNSNLLKEFQLELRNNKRSKVKYRYWDWWTIHYWNYIYSRLHVSSIVVGREHTAATKQYCTKFEHATKNQSAYYCKSSRFGRAHCLDLRKQCSQVNFLILGRPIIANCLPCVLWQTV